MVKMNGKLKLLNINNLPRHCEDPATGGRRGYYPRYSGDNLIPSVIANLVLKLWQSIIINKLPVIPAQAGIHK